MKIIIDIKQFFGDRKESHPFPSELKSPFLGLVSYLSIPTSSPLIFVSSTSDVKFYKYEIL